VALGGSAAALSGSNTVFTDDIVDNEVRTADVRNDTLAGGGLAAADLQPNSVGTSEVATNSLTGADINEASLTGNVRRLDWSDGTIGSPPPTTIATVGPYAIKGHCTTEGSELKTRLLVNGPASTADVIYTRTQNDVTDLGTSSSGLLTSANTDTEVVAFLSGPASPFPGTFRRAAGTVMLRSGSILVQVDFNAVADRRSNFPQICFIYGTATRAT
jgi:hypothetical protein